MIKLIIYTEYNVLFGKSFMLLINTKEKEMGIGEKFENFYKAIIMSPSDISDVSSRYQRITKKLNQYFYNSESNTNHCLYVGSYGRDTETFKSDIDMLFELPWSMYTQYNNHTGNGQSALLQKVKSAISLTYPNTVLKGDGQIISVLFYDGMTVEVLPAFKFTDGSYYYADTNNGGSWKKTDPKAEQKAVQELNNSTNKNYKKLCRIMRTWKTVNLVNIPGVLIDILTYNFCKNYDFNNKSYFWFDFFTRDLLQYISQVPKTQNKWKLMGSDRYIYHFGNFQDAAQKSYEDALKAIDYEERKNPYLSPDTQWRKIYGSKF